MRSRHKRPPPSPNLPPEAYQPKIYGALGQERMKWRCTRCHRGNDSDLPRPWAQTEIRPCVHCHKPSVFTFRLPPTRTADADVGKAAPPPAPALAPTEPAPPPESAT